AFCTTSTSSNDALWPVSRPSHTSDHVELAMPYARRPAAVGAQAIDFQAVASHPEAVLGRHPIEDLREAGIFKFDERAALAADEVVVSRVAVVVLVNFAIIAARHFPQQARGDHIVQCPIDGGPADARAIGAAGKPADKLVGVEVLVRCEDFFHN